MSELVELGSVPVESASLLLVDPCHLPADLVEKLTTPNAHGISLGLVLWVPTGDGPHHVASTVEDSPTLMVRDLTPGSFRNQWQRVAP